MLKLFYDGVEPQSLGFCTSGYCRFVFDWCSLGNKTTLAEQSPSSQRLFRLSSLDFLSVTAPKRPASPHAPQNQIEPPFQSSHAALPWCPSGQERGLTETLQISGLYKLVLIPLWSHTQVRHEGLLFYPLEPQATQRGPRNWVKSTHGGSGAVILNVIFTEATREFLWVTAKSQQNREAETNGARRSQMSPMSFFFFM